ncbi:MAG TPA: NrfD/PsrC family molybdoenzyme membrane anchor subunit [Chloroflexota bacterium]|nr:NrfD/PsrC family molybdoenzyme membrane anchor subunit [Chloroflexota bacterium]
MAGELQIPHWEWWIVLYFFMGGVAGGAYFLSAVLGLVGTPEDRPVARLGYYIAFPAALVCALLLIVDLGRPERFWHMMVYSNDLLPWPKWDSPMSVGSYALLFFGGFSFLSFLDALVETGRIPWAPFRLHYTGWPSMVYSVVGGLFGFFVTAYTGELLATSQLPAWENNPFLGALFAASGASTGMAAIALVAVLTGRHVGRSWDKLRRADSVAIVFEFLALLAFLAALGASALVFLSGVNALVLVGGVVLVGLTFPLVCQIRCGFRESHLSQRMTAVTAVLVLLGGLCLRTTIVMGGQGLL